MFGVSSYEVKQEIYVSSTSVVVRARRRADDRLVVIKRLCSAQPSPEDVGRLRGEYDLLKSLAIPEVVQPVGFEMADGCPALVSEDGGEPVPVFARTEKRQIADFLQTAIAVSQAIQAIHAKGVIHKDLKPRHLLVGSDGKVRVIDFGLSTKLEHEYCQYLDIDAAAGTLAYIAPEQTGRLNRPVDKRSDLYALGVSFFEMLTGQLPFEGRDPLELVHCHVAKPAPRADAVLPQIPAMVAAIIEKLMEKDAEDRYQSAAGLAVDLKRCLAEWEVNGNIEPFRLGERDLSEALTIPHKLYGRDGVVAALQAILELAGKAGPQLVLISGSSGIGKTALIRELHRHLPWRHRLVMGRYDALNRSEPYAGLASACREMARAVLSMNAEQFVLKKRALQEALGNNARVIMDMVPELDIILGGQPGVVALGPVESQNRFDQSFEAFVDAMVTSDEPMVMFLDDLQSADPASLRLLHLILTGHKPSRPLLVIGSYRDSEVSQVHPLVQELEHLRKSNVEVREIVLGPLRRDDVVSFVADALSRPVLEAQPLAAVLFERARGNPFDLGQSLAALHRDGLLYVDTNRHRWEWDLDRIQVCETTEDTRIIVLSRLRALPGHTLRLVGLGACIGNEFDFATMAMVSGLSRSELVQGVEVAVREDILIPLDHGFRDLEVSGADGLMVGNPRYRFVHNQLREAAYGLVAQERAHVHLKIGEHLRAALGEEPSDEQLFAVAHQMNLGVEHIQTADGRRYLASLNLRCGRKAQASAAIPQALSFLDQAIALAGEQGWSESYAIVCPAQKAKAECQYMRGDNDSTLAILDEIEAHATDVLDKVAALNLRTVVLVRLGRPLDGCSNSVAALRLLGVDLPDPTELERIGAGIGAEFAALQPELTLFSPGMLSEMSEPLAISKLETLAHAIPAAFQSVPPLMVLIVIKGLRLQLRQGVGDLMPFFLAQYAAAHLAITGDHAAAYGFGKQGLELGLRRQTIRTLGAVHFLFATLVAHWCEPEAKIVGLYDAGIRLCLDAGDLLYAVYCSTLSIFHRVIAGRPLAEVRQSIPSARKLAERASDGLNQLNLRQVERLAVALAGEGAVPGSLNGDGFDEDEFAARTPVTSQAWLRWGQTIVRFRAGMYAEAIAAATADAVSPSLACMADLEFYVGLCHAALARVSQHDTRAGHVAGLAQKVATIAGWVALCPANFAHRHALLAAELADLRGDALSAMEEYDKAIATARDHGILQNQALAAELAGEFHLRGRRDSIARMYLADALATYDAWGATGKVRELQQRYPDLAASSSESTEDVRPTARIAAGRSRRESTARAQSTSLALDMESAMRASEAIASELMADKLHDRLMRILVENAGAQRGVLLFPGEDDLHVEAEHTVSPDVVRLGIGQPLAQAEVPQTMVRYVARTQESAAWGSGSGDSANFNNDRYLAAQSPRSALCVPLLNRGQLRAVLYLENRALAHGFNPARISRIQFLAAQAAAALENSRLYEQVQAAKRDLEVRVHERTTELRQRNTDLRNVLDAVDQGLVTIDRKARVVGEWSARAQTWFSGIAEGEVWVDMLARVDAAYAKEFQALFTRVAQDDEPVAAVREGLARKLVLGARTLEIDLAPLGGDQTWKRMLVIISDVSDRERKARLEMDLRQAQKLQAVGELAAGIAHEINTPAQFVGDSIEFLATVCNQTMPLFARYRAAVRGTGNQVLLEEMQRAENEADLAYAEENAPGAIARASDGVKRIGTIVRAMKEFAHPDGRDQSTADLNRALETTLTVARNEYKYLADVETVFGELPLVNCHVGDLNQVFLNLIVNAAHAISDVVGKSGTKGRIVVRTFGQGDKVRIEIADSGCGIPAQIRDRVFDPFFTTKEVGRGSGQGLAIARNIVVDKHGGSLTFESEVGKGTTFVIVLPIDGGAASA